MILKDLMMSTVAKNKYLQSYLLALAAFFVVGITCFILIFASTFIPRERIISSIARGYTAIESRGDYPLFFAEAPKFRYDGFTDSLMMQRSIRDRNMTAFEDVVLAPYYAIGADTPEGSGTGGVSPTQSLLLMVSDPQLENNRDYVLYWHGYVLPLRILLSFMSPMSIIVLNCVIFALLSLLVFEVFRRTGGWAFGIAFIASLVATFAWIAPLGFQFFTSFLLAFLATLVLYYLLQKGSRRVWIVALFLTTGLLTAFFDFLTTPLLTFLLPLALFLFWCAKKEIGRTFFHTTQYGAGWLLGYAGFWSAKWGLAASLKGFEYANAEFAYAIAQRGGSAGSGLEYRIAAIYNNLYQLVSMRPDGSILMGEFFMLTGIVVFVAALIWWLLVKASKTETAQIKRALPLLLVAAGPYVWYFVVAGHSTFHSWFTYRLQMATVLAVIFFILLSIDWSGLRHIYQQKRGN